MAGLFDRAVRSLPRQTAKLLRDQVLRAPEEHAIAAFLATDALPVDVSGGNGHHYGAFSEAARLAIEALRIEKGQYARYELWDN
ncbi:hypothetical protein SLS53_001453 [Cytospora paraplurivora]|uniref:Uncharacterized protein n=1 Tax=Cytospora paraplurivora TaxID=2898453 RepID=A0AAN9UIR9_9PEZI